jgi:predicted phosphodiesterase
MEKENIKLAEIFSDYQTNVYETKIGDKNFHFEHGDMFFSKDRWEFFLSVPAFIRNPLSDFFHFIIYKLFPRSTVKNKIGVKMNNHIKEVQDPDKIYVVGHTHVPEIDLEAKFVNTGAIIRNFVYYVEIDEQGNAKLIKDSSR